MDLEAIIKALEQEQSPTLPVAVDAGPQLAEVLTVTAMHVGPSLCFCSHLPSLLSWLL